MVLLSIVTAHAQERVLVMRGKEIVVSYKPTRQSSVVGAYAVQNLRLPVELKVQQVMSQGRVAVVSESAGIPVSTAEPVQVDVADIERQCTRILDANGGIPLHCEPNRIRAISKTPNDPYLEDLYGLSRLDAYRAWDVTTGSSNVIVAVVDTGVYYNHSDLIGNIAINTRDIPNNGIDDDANGYTDDYFGYDFYDLDGDPVDENGHGTHCAGIAGGSGDNGTGVVGINWEVGILPVRVLGANGTGMDADVASGIQYAVDRGASIVSLSLGGEFSSTVLENAIQYARDRGVLVVAAAGNENENNDVFPTYPASAPFDNIVAVAATDSSDNRASYSNYGPYSVHVAAPGSGILSTYLANQFGTKSGTSMATPYVAGVAALMKAANPALSYAQLRSGLIASSDPLAALTGKVVANGRVNAYRAVMSAWTGEIPPAPTPIAAPGESGTDRTITIRTKRYGRQAIIHGYIKTVSKVALADKRIYLSCKRIRSRRTKSDQDGFYAFTVRRPRNADRCFVRDALKNRSRGVVVR
jgi:subtilisin family serine protease